MTESISQENSNDKISSKNYKEDSPVYQIIKRKFTKKLQDKYSCENYDAVTNYVFDYVFNKKMDKSKCIEELNPYFNGKASEVIDYLWTMTREEEEKAQNSEKNFKNYNYKKGGKNYDDKYKNRQKYPKNRRERSRSDSREKGENMYENYQNFPMQPKGFYPPKRFTPPMMGMGMGMGTGFSPYFQSPIPNYMR